MYLQLPVSETTELQIALPMTVITILGLILMMRMMMMMMEMITVQTLQATVTAKDLTLQLCALTHTPMNSTTVFCDVYILHLYGQVHFPPLLLTSRSVIVVGERLERLGVRPVFSIRSRNVRNAL